MVAEELAEAVDTGRFHLEVGDPVGAVGEMGKAVDKIGLAQTQAEDPALGAVEAGAGNGDALMEAVGKVTEQGSAGAAEIGLGEAMVQLCLGGERMEELDLVGGGIMAVEIEEVVDPQAMGGGDEAVRGYVLL